MHSNLIRFVYLLTTTYCYTEKVYVIVY